MFDDYISLSEQWRNDRKDSQEQAYNDFKASNDAELEERIRVVEESTMTEEEKNAEIERLRQDYLAKENAYVEKSKEQNNSLTAFLQDEVMPAMIVAFDGIGENLVKLSETMDGTQGEILKVFGGFLGDFADALKRNKGNILAGSCGYCNWSYSAKTL